MYPGYIYSVSIRICQHGYQMCDDENLIEFVWTGISEMPTDYLGPDQRCLKVHIVREKINLVHKIPMYYYKTIYQVENIL